jgi:hypothetical protein
MGYSAPASTPVTGFDEEVRQTLRPVFVLSTGRCGTKWLTDLLRHSRQLRVNHSDYPELIRQGVLAYRGYASNPEMFQEIVRACRDGYLAQAHSLGQLYVETNNRITFLAPAVKRVYPGARFIHLVRHPADFVRSGLRRGWYEGVAHDEGRIVNLDDPDGWQGLTGLERIAWLWNETNRFIESFLAEQPAPDKLTVLSEAMFTDEAVSREIIEFIGATDLVDKDIEKVLRRRVNVQKGGRKVNRYEEWSEEEKTLLWHRANLAQRYGYVQ